MLSSPGGSELEDVEDALVDGDVPYQRGTAAAALRHRNFRIVYVGTFSSNIGTWMQNVILGEFALNLTHSGFYVGLLYFGQLGPLLFLSMMGGLLADRVDRRRLLVTLQIVQGGLSFVLAAVAWTSHPSTVLIAVLVFAIGIANALGAPGLSAILPTLVPPEDLTGAVALTSVQMNLSRVIGPAIGGLIFVSLDAGPVFAINAVTYVFAVIGLVWARYPRYAHASDSERRKHRLLDGVRIARADPVIKYVLLTLFSFSFFSVTFVGILPVVAEYNLHVTGGLYGLLYATFGVGAARGRVHGGLGARPPVEGRVAAARVRPVRDRARDLRAVAQRPRRVRRDRGGGLPVLPRDHVPVDDHPEAIARRTTRTGDGVVDHALRGNGSVGRARRRTLRQGVLDRSPARRGRVGVGARGAVERPIPACERCSR